MATRKQRRAKLRRAQHASTRRHPPGAGRLAETERVDELFSDEQLLRWLRADGVDLTDREQLLDAAAVGLSVVLWRNTSLEDVHSGAERYDAVHERAEAMTAGHDADIDRMLAEARAAGQAQRAVLDADVDAYTAVADERERARLALLLDHRREGAGIPDDVMMRLNASTVRQVRAVLDEHLPAAATHPGGDLPYPRDGVPDFLGAVYALVTDPDRPMTVGGAGVTAGELLSVRGWETFHNSVLEKMTRPTVLADAIGARQVLWLAALTGATYGGDWWPSPAWPGAVADLQEALAAGQFDRVWDVGSTDRWCPPPGDAAFWAALSDAPETLNARQARWVIGSRLGDRIQERRRSRAATLGTTEADRFASFPLLL